ncbi:MAG: phosphoglycerate kinase [Halobacteriota archaeon]|nr:phosphoglycerate kinase [Halobacteriota archaeon]
MEYLTMSDAELKDKVVLVRLDLNSPIKDGAILDDKRFRSHLETLEGLKDSKAVLMSHQGRPGGKDFTTMEAHKEKLSELMGREIKYIDDIFGSHARNEIGKMKKGDILLLENLRFYSEESLKRSPEEHAETHLVRNLASSADIFINDAFSTAHRSQLSIVGFTPVLPSFAGRLMEKEINAHEKVLKSTERPCTFVLGGIKVDDSINVTKNVLEKGIADNVILTGLVANVFLAASGTNIGKPNLEFISSQGYDDQIDVAKEILTRFNEKIMLPVDFALNKDGKREEVTGELEISYPIRDIGSKTVAIFQEKIRSSKTVVVNGPAGVFEDKEFSYGTFEILKSVSECEFGVIGGGHIVAALGELGIEDKMWHVSTGGGACISYLSGETLPGVTALSKR